ncbi:rho-related protein racD-like [Ruditapes philippinarum]|uniref:rho-related protein racD-like n=1 Tax=Ruditapes philippinarum TaxID=129788 RepID=UPI00295B7C24|nr:rho-related protein racD-like [Ruditapes philippinarum]
MKRTFNEKVVQCTIVGDSSVGKTSLVKKFLRAEENKEDVTPTVFDNFSGKVTLEEEGESTISIFDTTGDHDFEGLRQLPYVLSDVIVVCFSVIDRESYNSVSDFWLPEIKKYTKKGTAVVLVATHCDLRNRNLTAVENNEGVSLANKIGAYSFIETSTKDIENISKLFEIVVTKVTKKRKNIFSKLFRR